MYAHLENGMREEWRICQLVNLILLAPTCKGRHVSRFLPLLQSYWPFHSAARSSLQITSDGFQHAKQKIEINLLFLSCTNLHLIKCLNALLVVSGKVQSIIISTRLVNEYAKLGDVSFSRRIFDQMQDRNVYTWNSMVYAYVRTGHFCEAINCFYQFVFNSGLRPDFYTFPPVLKACRNVLDGKKIHCSVFKLGFQWDVFVAASLIHMYSRFGIVGGARKLFNDMPVCDMGCWNAMVSGYCQNVSAVEALDILDEMRLEGVKMDSRTVASLLPVCAQSGDVLSGMLIHLYVIKHGLVSYQFVSNGLINMYAKFGSLREAQMVFDQMVARDVVSWNSIIAAYEQNDDPTTALALFNEMQLMGVQSDIFTIVSLVSVVTQLSDCRNSKSVHGFIMRRGWLMDDVVIGSAVVDMYAKLGFVDAARVVFEELPVKDVISRNTLITGYVQNGLACEAIEVYRIMEDRKEIIPNRSTWIGILPAYTHVGALQQGMKVHGRLIKNGLYMDVDVATCLVDMYGKCGRLHDAMALFYEIPRQTSFLWNAIISCHGVHGDAVKALNLFKEMVDEGVKPDDVTFVSLLSACSHSGLVDEGQWCFCVMREEYRIRPHLKHYGCMVDLFGRAGYLEMADNFIKNMPIQPDASIWGALLGACKIHGNVELGEFASDRLLEVDSENAGCYILLSNIYANVGKWERADKVRLLARGRGLKKTPGWSSIEVNNKVDVFYSGNQTHPKSEEIYEKLRLLTEKMKSLGYTPDYSFVLQDVEDDEKENILTSHE